MSIIQRQLSIQTCECNKDDICHIDISLVLTCLNFIPIPQSYGHRKLLEQLTIWLFQQFFSSRKYLSFGDITLPRSSHTITVDILPIQSEFAEKLYIIEIVDCELTELDNENQHFFKFRLKLWGFSRVLYIKMHIKFHSMNWGLACFKIAIYSCFVLNYSLFFFHLLLLLICVWKYNLFNYFYWFWFYCFHIISCLFVWSLHEYILSFRYKRAFFFWKCICFFLFCLLLLLLFLFIDIEKFT